MRKQKKKKEFNLKDFRHHIQVIIAIVILFGLIYSFAIQEKTITGNFIGSGSGSEGDPFQITDWDELNDTRNNLSANYVLENDIGTSTSGYSNYNTGYGFQPIGDNSNKFTGTFDGQNHTITGLYINNNSKDYRIRRRK